MTVEAYHKELEARGRKIQEVIAPKAVSMYGGHVLLATDGDPNRVEEIVVNRLGVEPMGPFARVGAGTFDVFAAMHLVSRWSDRLTKPTLDHVKNVVVRGVHHRGNTENHWLMFYVGNLLATEFWTDVEIWWNGISREAMRAEAMRWILGMIDRTARVGHHEYDSTIYHGWHLLPMIALADHAQDPYLKEQAAKVATLYVADMALEYFHGAWAGGHAREGSRQNTWKYIGTSSALAYYFFGDAEFDPLHAQEGMCPVTTAYFKPPPLFAEIARDRSAARVVRKTKAPREIYRHVDRFASPVRKYTYMSRSFALGSTQAGLPGAPAGPIDLVSWDLTWCRDKNEGTVVCNHPYVSPGRFSGFLSELPQAIGRSVAAPKPFLQYPDRLFGASPYEQMLQHEGALVALYRIPEEDPNPYINLFLPRGTTWVERDGWILGDAGEFHMGLRPIGDYRWESIAEDTAINGWLVRISGHDVGLVVETIEADEAGSFNEFCDAIVQPRIDLSGWPEAGEVLFNTVSGHSLRVVYDGDHSVDGVVTDYDSWDWYEGPGITAPLGKGKFSIEYADERVDLDFNVDESEPMLPMRVIG